VKILKEMEHLPDIAEIASLFDQRGLRWTVQRQLVLQIIQQNSGHLSVDDVYQEVARTFPSVNRSTVYRTLELLNELGVIVETQSGDNLRRYEMIHTHPHYHALCEKCGGDMELDNALMNRLKADIWEHYQLKLSISHFVGLSICEHCQQLASHALN